MNVLEKIKNGLIVSCQAEEGSPFNTPKGVGDFARCAELGRCCQEFEVVVLKSVVI